MAAHDVDQEKFDEGYDAYHEGKEDDACPYHPGSPYACHWNNGWWQAYDDEREKRARAEEAAEIARQAAEEGE